MACLSVVLPCLVSQREIFLLNASSYVVSESQLQCGGGEDERAFLLEEREGFFAVQVVGVVASPVGVVFQLSCPFLT